jgi:hypothetical protein
MNKEILVGKHIFCLGEDNILYITIVGEIDDKTNILIKKAVTELLDMIEERVNVLVDIDKAVKLSVKTRALVSQFHTDKRVGKIAHLGHTPVARVLAAFSKGIIRKRDMRFFYTKESALAWLKEE